MERNKMRDELMIENNKEKNMVSYFRNGVLFKKEFYNDDGELIIVQEIHQSDIKISSDFPKGKE